MPALAVSSIINYHWKREIADYLKFGITGPNLGLFNFQANLFW
jgi:hypothetical protein